MKTNNADPNGTYLSVSMATDGLSMQRVTFESTPSPGNKVGMGAMHAKMPPSHPSPPTAGEGARPPRIYGHRSGKNVCPTPV